MAARKNHKKGRASSHQVIRGFSKQRRLQAVENDPRFLKRIAQARKTLRAGRGVALEDFDKKRLHSDS
jgi:hypothetical protein